MKKYLFVLAAAMFSLGAYAQIKPQPTTLPINVGVELSDYVNVSKVADVYFGGVYIPESADVTVTMDKTGLVKVTSGTTTLYNQVSQRMGQIKIAAGETDFNLTAPSTINLKNHSVQEGETVPDLVYTPSFFDMAGNTIDMSASKYLFDEAVYSTITIGGNLVVPADAFRGQYSGVMNVTISWL